MTLPHPPTAVLMLLVAQLTFAVSLGLSALNVGLALAGMAAALGRGRLPAPASVLWVLLVPVLALPLLPIEMGPTLALGRASTPFLYRAILLVSLGATAVSFVRWEPQRQWWLTIAAMLLTMASGMTFDPWPYGGLVAIQMVLLVAHLRARDAGRLNGERLVCLPLAALVAGLLATTLAWSESRVNDMMAWFTPPMPVSAQFQAHSHLESMLDRQASGRVVMRVLTLTPPRHLVGAVYNTYERDTWSQRSGLRDLVPQAWNPDLASASDRLYRLSGAPGVVEEEYRLADASPGSLFVSRGTCLVEAPLQGLRGTWDGALHFQPGPGFDGSYRVRRDRREVDPAVLPEAHRNLYLQLPVNLPPILRHEAARRAPGSTPGALAGALEEWFQDGFTYGLGYPFDRDRNPLEQFLRDRPPAHCEFFATAMTLMLRVRGVPARYVTGFLVTERNRPGGYFTVRESHAHAWTEAWIPKVGWATFDPTPPAAVGEAEDGLGYRLRQWVDLVAFQVQGLVARLRTGDWRSLWRAFLSTLEGAGLWLGRHPEWLGLVLVTGFGLTWWRGQGRLGSRKGRPDAESGPLHRMLTELDRLLLVRGLARPENLTLLEFRDHLQPLEPGEAQAVRLFLETWCRARYGARTEDRDHLEECLESVRRETRAARSRAQERGRP